jgi:hypothetical protein
MKFEEMTVTPDLARKWLEANASFNRPVRVSRVRYFRVLYESGGFRTTPQGIAFSTSGWLIDGQHRLVALSQMPEGFAIRLVVVTEAPDEVYEALDQGMRRRFSDVLGVSSGLISVANVLVKVYCGSNDATGSFEMVQLFSNALEPSFSQLVSTTSKSMAVLSSATVRAAACIQLEMTGEADHVLGNYCALINQDYSAMSAIVQSFNRQVTTSDRRPRIVRTDRNYMLLIRAMKAFDPENALTETLIIRDESAEIERVRDAIECVVLTAPGRQMPEAFHRSGAHRNTAEQASERRSAVALGVGKAIGAPHA